MGPCLGCVKYILFIFNFLLWLLGCALLSVGIWMKMDASSGHYVQQMTEKVDEAYQISYSATGYSDMSVTISYLLIVFGIVLIVVTFIGCCGAVRENTCLLIAFAVCLFLLMVALIGVGSWAYIRKNKVYARTEELEKRTDENLDKGVSKYFSDEYSKEFMDKVQARFRCCGSKDADKGYIPNRPPQSCERIERIYRPCNYYYFYYVGEEIQKFLVKRYTILSAVSFSVGFSLGIGLAVTIILCILIRRATRLVVS
ncbi:unnamed protein product [Lymnaea stagnalis]|uniref:Tetraspanin n=1 Tax=Lymnaea stagnalis TaxID=6523 RepID=A0AAV2HLB6_LYMST